MTTMIIVDETDQDTPESGRIKEVIRKLGDAGIKLTRIPFTDSDRSVHDMVEREGRNILPVTLVNGFPMIMSRYPTNDEIKQILAVPDGILEKRFCGCCCIEGCGDHH